MRTVIVCSLLLLCGCQTPPVKPNVELGHIEALTDEVVAGMTEGGPNYRQPLKEWDKATCFKSEWWAIEKTYVHDLEDYARTCDQARKALEANGCR